MNDTILILPSWLKIKEISRIVLWEKHWKGTQSISPSFGTLLSLLSVSSLPQRRNCVLPLDHNAIVKIICCQRGLERQSA